VRHAYQNYVHMWKVAVFAAVSQLRYSWDVLMLQSVLQPWWLLLVKSYLRIYCCYSVKQSVENFSDW